jgi:hypothetical protein
VDGEHTEIAPAPVKAAGAVPLKAAARQLAQSLHVHAPILVGAKSAEGFSRF